MQDRIDPDATPGVKLLRLFRLLLVDGRKHFQSELSEKLQCSAQTIIRMTNEIETVIGANLETGIENRRRWYRMVSNKPNKLGLEFEELRYLSVCRDFAAPSLPEPIRMRVDDTIFNLSVLMAEQGMSGTADPKEPLFAFYSKGRIDYSKHNEALDALLVAVQEHRICQVEYKASGKEQSKIHRFAPGRLVSMNQAIYALGAILEKDTDNVRFFTHLAVHRMKSVSLLDETFNGDFPEFHGDTFGLPWHEPKAFHIRFKPGKAADYVRERIWADEQRIEEQDDGGVILHITTRSEPELMSWVRSFGEDAKLMLKSEYL